MDEDYGISINNEGDDEAKDTSDNIVHPKSSLPEIVAAKLGELISDGKLTYFELDEKFLEALKVFPVDEALSVLYKFEESSLEHVTNRSAYLLEIINLYQSKLVVSNNAAKGTNEEKIKTPLKKASYSSEITTNQQKYGHPPPGWDNKSLPGPNCEIFVFNIPKTISEDKLTTVFKRCGKIRSIRLMNPSTGLQYAFITYYDKEDALSAFEQLDEYEIRGKKLKLNISRSSLWRRAGFNLKYENADQAFDLRDFLVTRPLKLELEEFLVDIKWYQKALDFCQLLLEASDNILKLERNSDNMPDNKSDEILEQNIGILALYIQNIAASSEGRSSNHLAETFLKFFHFSDSTEGFKRRKEAKEAFAELLNINDTLKLKNAKDYLEQMISDMESLIYFNDLKQYELHYKRCRPLKKLFCELRYYRNRKAKHILGKIFEIHIADLDFTEEEEKKQIGAQMAEAIVPIQRYIDYLEAEEYTLPTLLERRSALQFIYDKYGQFRAGNTTLLEELMEAKMGGTIGILDKLIEKKRKRSKYFRLADLDEPSSEFVRFVKPYIPQSHEKWWSKCKLAPRSKYGEAFWDYYYDFYV